MQWFVRKDRVVELMVGVLLGCDFIQIICQFFFFFQAEDGIRDVERSRGLGDVYKRQVHGVLSITAANPVPNTSNNMTSQLGSSTLRESETQSRREMCMAYSAPKLLTFKGLVPRFGKANEKSKIESRAVTSSMILRNQTLMRNQVNNELLKKNLNTFMVGDKTINLCSDMNLDRPYTPNPYVLLTQSHISSSKQ
eukprot:TRINITY_DN16305_c0_g1_i3.p1 TRINITY_DN16305_c0_g1~~TRINITY_DN16305_c0_g1_i3.p1  ORF type:complete len:195 (-),score=19.48 TRINITY_DN16305_c0_g1_i3:87-671(-)